MSFLDMKWRHSREAFCNVFSKEVVLGEAKQSNSKTTLDPCLDCHHIEQRNSFLNGICSFSEDSKTSEICCVEQLFEQYQEADEIHKHLIAMAPVAIFLADTKTGIILEANCKAAELLGVPVDQIIGLHQTKLHPPEECQKYQEFFQKSLQIESGPLFEDTYVRHQDGHDIPVRISASLIRFDNKQLLLGIFSDISEEKGMLLKLKASEERFKALAEASFEAIIIHKDGHVIDINQNFVDLHGYTLEELQTMNVMELIAPDYHDIIEEKMASGFEYAYEVVGLRKDGSAFPLEIQARSAILNNQHVRIASGRDLTDVKRQQQKLISSEVRFKQLADASFEGIIIHDLDNQIIDFNQQLLDMYGYTSEELKKVPMMDMVAPQCRDTVEEKISSGYFEIYKTYGMKKDGTIFPVMVHCREAMQDNKPIRIVSLYDLTEREQLEEKLSESEAKYRELYKSARACLFRTRISDGMLLDCSRATARLFGYANEDEYKDAFSVTNTYVNQQQRESLIETLKKETRVHNYEVHVKRKDGSTFWVALSAEIFPEKDIIEGAMQDITVTKALSKTENAILNQLMQGMSNKEIAYQSGRSVRTIEDHRAHIMQKLGVDNIVDLTQKALKRPKHGSQA